MKNPPDAVESKADGFLSDRRGSSSNGRTITEDLTMPKPQHFDATAIFTEDDAIPPDVWVTYDVFHSAREVDGVMQVTVRREITDEITEEPDGQPL
jgi:hypothetical protein